MVIGINQWPRSNKRRIIEFYNELQQNEFVIKHLLDLNEPNHAYAHFILTNVKLSHFPKQSQKKEEQQFRQLLSIRFQPVV